MLFYVFFKNIEQHTNVTYECYIRMLHRTLTEQMYCIMYRCKKNIEQHTNVTFVCCSMFFLHLYMIQYICSVNVLSTTVLFSNVPTLCVKLFFVNYTFLHSRVLLITEKDRKEPKRTEKDRKEPKRTEKSRKEPKRTKKNWIKSAEKNYY